ncbi:MAG: helix-turn-helix transcriptional regulator [Woeseiaceae bacterium]|nr:helix-turn-helix transcriptional regulator [Woeseiaceae bacterium]
MVSALSPDKDFYAVRPELVLRAADIFGITSSMLDRGAKRLHSRAVAINAGKEAGLWGRHQRPVIEQYCAYTQSSRSDFLLPWAELVEHETRYDGKEGISTRTGNRPLSTVVRVLVNGDAIKRARGLKSISIDALSTDTGLPPALIDAMEAGRWPEVATSTAERIATGLAMPLDELFTAIDDAAAPKSDAPEQIAAGRLRWRSRAIAAAVLLALAFVGYRLLDEQSASPGSAADTIAGPALDLPGSTWRVSIELVNENIPVPDETRELFENGGYLELREGGAIGFNWFDPANLQLLPDVHRWRREGNALTLVLDGPVYTFALGDDPRELVALDNTRSFRATMHRIERAGTDLRNSATSVPDPEEPLVGCWRWSNGATVVVDAHGQASIGPVIASWTRERPPKYEIDWPDVTGAVTLDGNGAGLSSVDSLGVRSSARRIDGDPGSFVGTWQWDNGSIVSIAADGIMRMGNFSGRWSGLDRQYTVVWPLLDTITVAEDGRNLSGSNQFGAFTAYRIECR